MNRVERELETSLRNIKSMANGLLVRPHYDFDVAVVGSGPAGSRTAEQLATMGYSVALVERDPAPGHRVHCTGIVSDECFRFYSLPEESVLQSISSFILRSPKNRSTHIKRKTIQAWVLDRVSLDQHLATRAISAGVSHVTSTSVHDITFEGRVASLNMNTDGIERRITARIAVLATGFGTPIARRLGFNDVHGIISGCQSVVKAPNVKHVEIFTGESLGHGGFGWLVPWKPGYALAGVLTRAHAVRFMNSHINRLQNEGSVGDVVSVFRSRPIPLGVCSHSIRDGIVGVGDVVNQVKPTTGGGIYYGLLGADAAAQSIDEALHAGSVSTRGLQPYEEKWRSLIEPEIRQGFLLRRLIEQLPDSVIEQLQYLLRAPILRRLLVSAAPKFDWHSGPLIRVLARLEKHTDATRNIAV
jgi:digeranylgeranylglycerophospholipid reductase